MLVVVLLSINNESNAIAISINNTSQSIDVNQEPYQTIEIDDSSASQDIGLNQENPIQTIEVGLPDCLCKPELILAIDGRVPKALSVLPRAADEIFASAYQRELIKLYVDADGKPHYITMEQLKNLNTKATFVNNITDKTIENLSTGDIVFLKE